MKLPHRVVLACVLTLTLASCDSTISRDAITTASSGTTLATSSSPTVSNTLPGPHPAPNYNSDGTTFDPCLAYSSAELRGWGLDPSTVKGIADGLQRGCSWKGDGWRLQQLVNNRSISEYLDTNNYPDAQPVAIAGLQGSTHRLGQTDNSFCSAQIPSQRAVVASLVAVDTPKAQKAIPDPCAKAIEIATATAGKLPN